MTISVITAVIGGIDQSKELPAQSVEFDRLYFTEPIGNISGNDRMQALYYKCNLHRLGIDSDVLIWLDGKVQPTCYDFIEQIVKALGDNDIAVLKHHERDCIYKEIDHIEHCMRKGNQYLLTRYKDKPIRKQVEAYRYFGYPVNNGLNDCCIIAVKNNDMMKRIFNQWWRDVYRCNGFDQVALPFYCWLNDVKIQPIVFKPGSFIDVPHTVLK